LKSSFWPAEKKGSNINMSVRGACSGGQGGMTASQLLQTLWQDAAETVCGSMCVVDRRAGFLCRELLSTITSCTTGRSCVGCWDDVCHSCCWWWLLLGGLRWRLPLCPVHATTNCQPHHRLGEEGASMLDGVLLLC
jgi:hypothetical protein